MEPNQEFLAQPEEPKTKAPAKRGPKKVKTEAVEEAVIVPDQEKGVILSLDQTVQKEISRFEIGEAEIQKWKEEYTALVITDINDRQLVKSVETARKFIKNKRTAIENLRKEIVAPAVRLQKEVNDFAKDRMTRLSEIEAHLEKQEAFVDAEKKRLKEEQDRREQERIQKRSAELLDKGLKFNGERYSIGDLNIRAIDLKLMDDLTYNTFMTKADVLVAEEKKKDEEKARIAKEQAEAVKKAAEELAAREKAMAEKEAAIKAESDRLIRLAEELKAKQEALKIEALPINPTAAPTPEQVHQKPVTPAEVIATPQTPKQAHEQVKTDNTAPATTDARASDAAALVALATKLAAFNPPTMVSDEGKAVAVQVREQFTKFGAWLQNKADQLKNKS